MAFNVNELILDRVRSLTAHDLSNGEMLFRLTSLEDPSKVIARPSGFFIAPEDWEYVGDVMNVTFSNGWNAYFWPKIIASDEPRRVLTIGLAFLKNTFAGQAVANQHEIMAGAVLAVLPLVILFMCFQKYMMTGYSKAAMK